MRVLAEAKREAPALAREKLWGADVQFVGRIVAEN